MRAIYGNRISNRKPYMSNVRIPSTLNPQQRDAIKTLEGPVLVLAGAGTGKTRTVTERMAYLLRSGVKPEHILAVTFTNKAAGEMKERLAKMVRKQHNLKNLIASTFHSLCVRILRRDADKLGYGPSFSISDTGEQVGLVRKAMRHISGGGSVKPEDALYEIGQLKNKGILPQDFARTATDEWEQTLASVYRRYQESLKRINAFDFDDLLLKSVELLEGHEAVREHWARRFKYIMVDEFQDTNTIQLRMVELLASRWNNLCVVGDDDQSIYAWRGAVADNILHFDRRFPGAKTIRLEENYRSVNSVLKASNALIAHNEARCEKTLWSNLGPGEPVRVVAADDQQNEAERVVTEIKKRLMAKNNTPADFAIILRTNLQTRPYEEELLAARIPYAIIGGQSFYDYKEVRDVLSYLSAVANPRDDAALLRIINTPARGIGDRSVDALAAFAARETIPLGAALLRAGDAGLTSKATQACSALGEMFQRWQKQARGTSAQDLVKTILNEAGYQDEVAHLYDDPMEQAARFTMAMDTGDVLRNYLEREPKGGVAGFLQEMMLRGRDESASKDREKERNSVKLITAHSAKGLEFPIVYVVGLEEGLLPHKNAEENNTIDEERRLCYVALTRAQRELTLVYCRARILRGKPAPRTPSRFLEEIPADLLDRQDEEITRAETLDTIRALRERLAERAG